MVLFQGQIVGTETHFPQGRIQFFVVHVFRERNVEPGTGVGLVDQVAAAAEVEAKFEAERAETVPIQCSDAG